MCQDKELPRQQFSHSTNLCRTHDHQTEQALQVYLTYIATVALRISCLKYNSNYCYYYFYFVEKTTKRPKIRHSLALDR